MTTSTLHPCKRFEWERIVRRCLIPRATKFVAFTLAQYGSANGEQIRPGIARLAAVCEMGESTVRKHIDALRKLGLVERVSNGGGPNQMAARYRLTVPDDLLERVQLLDPDETTPLATVSAVRPPRGPVDNEDSATQGERSSRENSAHSSTELRSFSGVTPLDIGGNSATPGERPPTDQGGIPTNSHQPASPNAAVSPVDDEYNQARSILARLSDLGASLIESAPDTLAELRDRIVWAAGQVKTA